MEKQLRWMAWATIIPMTDAGPINEPADPLWFEFGATEEEAIECLKTCVESEADISQWIRQPI